MKTLNQDYRRPTGYPLGDGLLSKITALAIIIAHRYFIKRIIQNFFDNLFCSHTLLKK
jgi:hypothetical protein